MARQVVKFFWNGIKINGGKLIRGWFSYQKEFSPCPGKVIPEQVTFYARDYCYEGNLRDVFAVKNDSDSMTDYFETDTIRFPVGHPMFELAKAASVALSEKRARDAAKLAAKRCNNDAA